jgi:adenylate cyclase
MNDSGVTKRLSAILAADIAGYTRLMESDSDGTVAAWKAARTETIDPSIAKHSGRIVKHTGDGFLAEFETVQAAVECAVAMQDGLKSSSLKFRMGINLGDIIDDGEDIHGEGVNIAARIEALAEEGGVSLSGGAYEQVRNRLDCRFEDTGEHEVKHVTAPVRVYRILSTQGEFVTNLPVEELQLPDKPSIAVLPFDNMSGDPEQEYFVDGIVEDILTTLSKIPALFVTARNSSFKYKGQSPDLRDVGRDLGVKYVVEGSVRKAGNSVRVTAQLIDTLDGKHVWADKYDGELDDIFELQDRITREIVIRLEVNLTEGEQVSIWRERSGSPLVYETFVKARDHYIRFSRGCSEFRVTGIV